MDKLTNLISFIKVIENGSISAAARSLNLTQPAVSQHLRNLEHALGARLLNRTTRKLTLTEAGEIYYNQIRGILEQLTEADRSVQVIDQQMKGTLKISAPIVFGAETFSDLFISFKRQYPNLILDLDMTDQYVDLANTGIDVAIRLGAISDERLIVKKLGKTRRVLVATPGYLNSNGRPDRPEDLVQHDYLLFSRLTTGDIVPLTHRDGRRENIQIRPCIRLNNSVLLKNLLRADFGIGVGHYWILRSEIENGSLEHVLPDWSYEPQDIHVVYPSNRYIPAKVRRFVEALSCHFEMLGIFVEERAV